MNKTPVSSNTSVIHRVERLIGSSYHQPYHQKKNNIAGTMRETVSYTWDRLVVISGQFLKRRDTVA